MGLYIIQLITVIALGLLLCVLNIFVFYMNKDNGELGEGIWEVKVGKEVISLPEGTYFAGSSWFNDIRLRTKGDPIKLFFNVQKEKIVLSVLKGKVQIRNVTYGSNRKGRITLGDFSKVKIQNCELQFIRKKV